MEDLHRRDINSTSRIITVVYYSVYCCFVTVLRLAGIYTSVTWSATAQHLPKMPDHGQVDYISSISGLRSPTRSIQRVSLARSSLPWRRMRTVTTGWYGMTVWHVLVFSKYLSTSDKVPYLNNGKVYWSHLLVRTPFPRNCSGGLHINVWKHVKFYFDLV